MESQSEMLCTRHATCSSCTVARQSLHTGDVPTTGYMLGRGDLAETVFVQSVYDPAMGAMDLPQIQVPRHEYTSNLAIAWTIQMSAIKKLKQHTYSKVYVGTWDNKQGSTR